jgi:prepilin-type N-terminal cleavage/methylation domain-containing protein
MGREGERLMDRWNQSGMTMAEVAITIAIIAILSVAAFPQLSNLRDIMGTKGASQEVAGSLRQARQYAVTRGIIHCVVFQGNPTTFTILVADANGNCTAGANGGIVQSATLIGHDLAVLTYNPPLASQTLPFDPIGRVNIPGFVGPQDLDVGLTAGQCPRNTVELSRFGGVRVFHASGC